MITLSDVINFALLSRFFSNIANKIFLFTKESIWVGVGTGYNSVMTNLCKRTNYVRGTDITLTASNSNVVVVYPATILCNMKLVMNGYECPITITTETINGVSYKVIKSDNTYEGTFKVSLV